MINDWSISPPSWDIWSTRTYMYLS